MKGRGAMPLFQLIGFRGAIEMTKSDKIKSDMINEILMVAKVNRVHISADTYFTLLFATESELTNICRGLNIKVPVEVTQEASNINTPHPSNTQS